MLPARSPSRRSPTPVLGGLLLAVALGGCAAPAGRPVDAPVATSAAALGLVMVPGAIQPEAGPEAARRDGALGLRDVQPLLATREWPEPARASLAERRTINLRASSFGESILYFGPERRR